MAEPPSLWQQSDLLGLLGEPEADDPQPPDGVAPSIEPVVEPSAEPVVEPSAEPVVEPSAEPVAEAPGAAAGSPGTAGCPATLLIVDTETSGLDPATGQCLEVGAVLFDVAARAVLCQVSFLLPAATNPARHVNGIDPAVTQRSQPWRQGLELFGAMAREAQVLVAHNATFDRQWFGIAPLPAIDRPWICSMEDIRWPADRHLRATPSVRDLALAYGVPVWAAHRALTDCIYLVQVFERCADLEALLLVALEPRRLFRARLGYAERHQAKEAGFRWNHPVAGAWSRRLSAREVQALPFPVEPVEPMNP